MIILLMHIETNRLAIILSSTWLQRTGHLEFKSIDQTSYLPEQFIKGLTTASLQGRTQVVPDRACIPTASDEFSLPEDFPTASEERFPLLSQKDATAEEVCTADEVKVIEFGDSYEAPQEVADTGSASEGSAKKKGRTVAVTTEDMQKGRNDVKARTTLLLVLPDEHQLRFSKYKTAQELWAAILKTFSGNDATKKTKKNQLKQQNRSDLDTMSLDDLFNHLKVYEPEVQKKSESNYQNMAFISSAKNSSGKEKVNTASFSTASTQVSPASANVAAASISLDTACAYIASQSNGSQIKYKDINQIDEDDIEEMDIKECRAPRSQDRGRRENFKQGSKVEESAPKALIAIDRVGWDWSYMANKEEDHAFVAEQEALTEFALMAKSSSENKTGLPEFADDTITDYSRPSPSIESNSSDIQNIDSSVSENGESSESFMSKPMIRFVKAADSPTVIKTNKYETIRKPSVKYAEMPIQRISAVRTQSRVLRVPLGNSQNNIDDKGYWDNGCSRHMTGNISYLSDYEPFDGGYKKDVISLSQDKYVGDILKKFGYSDVRSMIESLMYLTTSRPDIMFAVCTYARHQVTPKECHLHAVKRIFRYLKSHPKLGIWYPKDSPFDLVAYSDSDYGGATQDRKSTTGGCQFLGRRLISWQCKKQTIVATSTTEA
nr:hypothetical protein [Tanacetum cinerariifolium]